MTRDEVYSWWTPEQLMYGCERLVSSLHSRGSEPIFFGEAVTDFFIAFCNEGGKDTPLLAQIDVLLLKKEKSK